MANPKRGLQISEWTGQTLFDLHQRFVDIWNSIEAVNSVTGIDAVIPIAPVAPATVAGSATFTRGILTAYTPPS